MSLDLDVAPLGPPPAWGKVCERWRVLLDADATQLLGGRAVLRRTGTDRRVGVDERLCPPLFAVFDLSSANTMSLTVMDNRGNLSERDYIEDYGRNLAPSEAADVATRWRNSGYSFGLSSAGGRSRNEPELLVALALALAEVTPGVVIIMNDGIFDRGVGVYAPMEFRGVRWASRRPA